MNDLEQFFASWAEAYAVISRLVRRCRAPGSTTYPAHLGCPAALTPPPHAAPDDSAAAHTRWMPARPALREDAAAHVTDRLASALRPATTPQPEHDQRAQEAVQPVELVTNRGGT